MTDRNMADVADKAVDKLAAGVEAVAEAFKKVAPHVWEVMVRQAVIDGCATLVLLVMAWSGFAWLFRVYRASLAKHGGHTKDFDETPAFFLAVAVVISAIVLAVITCAEIPESIGQVANPEYYAAKELLGAVK